MKADIEHSRNQYTKPRPPTHLKSEIHSRSPTMLLFFLQLEWALCHIIKTKQSICSTSTSLSTESASTTASFDDGPTESSNNRGLLEGIIILKESSIIMDASFILYRKILLHRQVNLLGQDWVVILCTNSYMVTRLIFLVMKCIWI